MNGIAAKVRSLITRRQGKHTMESVRKHIGVDVGKEWLDICHPDGTKEHVRNSRKFRRRLIEKAKHQDAIVSFEATGPYEEALAEECTQAGVKAVRLDAWATRKYAESQGRIEKTDEIDSEMIRDFAASLKAEKLHLVKPVSLARRHLKRLVAVRDNLLKAVAILRNQLEALADDTGLRRDVNAAIRAIERKIEKVEAECDEVIASDDEMRSLSERFLRVKGVGPCLVRTVLASCADIGAFNSKSIAKMSGNAPIDHRSCTIVRKSKPRRGRSDLKKAFYMAAVSASRSNQVLHGIYQRLVSRGKPKKVALVAVARHLAIVLNYIAKYPDFEPEPDQRRGARNPSASREKPKMAN